MLLVFELIHLRKSPAASLTMFEEPLIIFPVCKIRIFSIFDSLADILDAIFDAQCGKFRRFVANNGNSVGLSTPRQSSIACHSLANSIQSISFAPSIASRIQVSAKHAFACILMPSFAQ
jgi:hypothetical protein